LGILFPLIMAQIQGVPISQYDQTSVQVQPPVYVITNPYAMNPGFVGQPMIVTTNPAGATPVPVQYAPFTMSFVPQSSTPTANTVTNVGTLRPREPSLSPEEIGNISNFLKYYLLGSFFPVVTQVIAFAFHRTVYGKFGAAISLANVSFSLSLLLWLIGSMLSGYFSSGVWWFVLPATCSLGAYLVGIRIWREFKMSLKCTPELRLPVPEGMEAGYSSDYGLAFVASCFFPVLGSMLVQFAKPKSLRVRYGSATGFGYALTLLALVGLFFNGVIESITWIFPVFWAGSTIISFAVAYYSPLITSAQLGTTDIPQ